jgi:tetratricopeptide (TPR) repeat protein/predicted Fe-Mo cluster-binding NifX family protein
MAKEGLIALACAAAFALVGLDSLCVARAGDDRAVTIEATLAIQTAMQQARESLHQGDTRAAIAVLERNLPVINGNTPYLNLLRDTYRSYIQELRTKGQQAEADRYAERLKILDSGAPGAAAPAPKAPVAAPKPPERVVRGVSEEEFDDPFRDVAAPLRKKSRGLLQQAEQEFGSQHYQQAARLFDEAHQTDPGATSNSKDRWAYCKLHQVVEQLNRPDGPEVPLPDLEEQVRKALELAPQLAYAKQLLGEIEKRKNHTPVAAPASTSAAPVVKHFERGADGWARAETANFRVFHNQSKEIAEQAALIAEKTRTEMSARWFGGFKEDWSPKCDLYLHANGQDYNKATGVSAGSPGHSSIRSEGSRVISRRIDLHCEDTKNMLAAVLPHEATHVVLAGQFGEQPVPRWADEGIAVLTEPREKVDRHLKNLVRCRQETGLFTAKQLMQMTDYPDPKYVGTFYAESVSLVEFLSTEKGPEELPRFIRDASKVGYEQALQQHYQYKTFEELQQKWHQKAFAAAPAATGTGYARAGAP